MKASTSQQRLADSSVTLSRSFQMKSLMLCTWGVGLANSACLQTRPSIAFPAPHFQDKRSTTSLACASYIPLLHFKTSHIIDSALLLAGSRHVCKCCHAISIKRSHCRGVMAFAVCNCRSFTFLHKAAPKGKVAPGWLVDYPYPSTSPLIIFKQFKS